MNRNRLMTSAVFLLMSALQVVAQAPSSPLFGELKPGPYAVGFKVLKLADSSRPTRAKQDYFGNPDNSDRARQLYIHLWYPAKAGTAPPMTFEDYIYSSDQSWPQGMTEAAKRQAQADVRNRIRGFFGNFPDTSWSRLLPTKLLAQRDAEAATGRFPLVVGTLRELSTTITNEYLASHGYVIAFVQFTGERFDADPATSTALILGNEVRNLELLVSHLRTTSFVDPLKLATLGFSGSGLAQVLFAMRYPDVDALALLETGIWGPSGSSYTKTPLYDVKALRVPFFFSYSDSSIGRWPKEQFAEFEKLKFSTRHYLKVNVPNFHHWDFATEGMATSTVLSIRGEQQAALRQGFELTNLYLLHFLNAYVKKDPESLALLRRAPTTPHIASLEEKPGLKPAPSRMEFPAIIEQQGIERAIQVYREMRSRDPEAFIYQESQLNFIATQLTQQNKWREAIELLKLNAETHSQSANARLSLGNAYRDNNQTDEASRQYDQALAVVPNDPSLNDTQKFQFRNNLGNQFRQRRELSKAIEVFKLNVEAYPKSASALNSLGDSYREVGQKELAMRQFEKALELLPGDPYLNATQKDQLKVSLQQKLTEVKQGR